ncbi:MAG: transposase [Rhodospirillales bacterium]
MVNYRRARVPGATYFFTVTLRDRHKDWLTVHVDLLRSVIRDVRRQRPFIIDAAVVLPDHLHTLWTLPDGDADFSGRWRAIKARFSRELVHRGLPLARDRRGEYDLWQRRFWEHLVRDDEDFARHVDYIHHNPVKHGLVADPIDWRWSSIHAFVRRGHLVERADR